MYSKDKLKKLAKIASTDVTIDKNVKQFIMEHLTKNELKQFLFYFKLEIQKKKISVYSPAPLSKESKDFLTGKFTNYFIEELVDKTLGGGLKIQMNDLVIDFTIKKYINDTIEKLKN